MTLKIHRILLYSGFVGLGMLLGACNAGLIVGDDGVGGTGAIEGATTRSGSTGIVLRAASKVALGDPALDATLENGSRSPVQWGVCGYDWTDSSGRVVWDFDTQDEVRCQLISRAPIPPGGSAQFMVEIPRAIGPGLYHVVFSLGFEGRSVDVVSNPIEVGGE